MPPEVSDFIPSSLVDTDKHIDVAYGHYITVKQKGQVRMKFCDDNIDTLIAALHNILLAPNLRDRLFYIVTLTNLGHTCLFYKGFCNMYFLAKVKMRLH